MAQFNDKYLHSIDQKGRLSLSKDVRDRMKIKQGDVIHVIPNAANPPFLELRTDKQWKAYEERVSGQESSEEKRDFMRFIDLMHEKVKVDAQGRVVVSRRLRELCGLGNTAAVISVGSCLEVWNEDHVVEKYQDMVRAFNNINSKLF